MTRQAERGRGAWLSRNFRSKGVQSPLKTVGGTGAEGLSGEQCGDRAV